MIGKAARCRKRTKLLHDTMEDERLWIVERVNETGQDGDKMASEKACHAETCWKLQLQ